MALIDRNYEVIGQLEINATDPATAQAAAEAAVAAIRTALATLDNGVVFSAEMENGQFVFSET